MALLRNNSSSRRLRPLPLHLRLRPRLPARPSRPLPSRTASSANPHCSARPSVEAHRRSRPQRRRPVPVPALVLASVRPSCRTAHPSLLCLASPGVSPLTSSANSPSSRFRPSHSRRRLRQSLLSPRHLLSNAPPPRPRASIVCTAPPRPVHNRRTSRPHCRSTRCTATPCPGHLSPVVRRRPEQLRDRQLPSGCPCMPLRAKCRRPLRV